MNTTKVHRTYGSHNRRNTKSTLASPSSPPSALASSPPPTPPPARPTKRTISQISSTENSSHLFSPRKRLKSTAKSPATAKPKLSKALSKAKATTSKGGQQKTLTQLHFNIDQPILRTCSLCGLSYTKGAPDDEALHRVHCTRVRQGMEWGREEEKDRMRGTENVVVEVGTDVRLKGKRKGRIISFPADIGGKLGAKLTTLLQTVNLSLSAPDLPPSALQHSKVYIFLIPHETKAHRERIAGCVVAQRISTAMAVIPSSPSTDVQDSNPERPPAVILDAETNLCCSPEPLPTPMGISRLFVSSSHRRLGIAHSLLDAASTTFIHGCPLDPTKGQVAFSQPTGMGQAVMNSWGKGGVRVYEE